MRILNEVADVLESYRRDEGLDNTQLASDVGVKRVTATRVLSGSLNFSVNTLLALSDRLDLEWVLVPK